MTQPQKKEPPRSTTAQKVTALAVTPVGILALVILLPLVLCVGCCAAGAVRDRFGTGRDTTAPETRSAEVTATATATALDERSACMLLVPQLERSLNEIKAYVAQPDGSTVDRSAVRTVIANFTKIKQDAPEEMRGDIDKQIRPLQSLDEMLTGHPATEVNLGQLQDGALRLLNRCKAYAR